MSPREQLLSTAAEMHSAQDGLTAGVLTGLVMADVALVPVVAVALGFGAQRLSRRQLAKRLPDLLRTSQIRSNPEYFVLAGVLAFLVTRWLAVWLPT